MRRKIGETLIAQKVITEASLQIARLRQKRSGGRLGDILVRLNLATETQIAQALSEQNGIPYRDLFKEPCDPAVTKLIPRQFAVKNRCIACELKNNELRVAMADPLSLSIIHDLEFATGYRIGLYLATPSQMMIAIENCYGERAMVPLPEDSGTQQTRSNETEVSARAYVEQPEGPSGIQDEVEVSGPIASFVDGILEEAVVSKTSDIHLEASEDGVVVRNRLDGLLREVNTFPKWAHDGLITRLKVMASMDIAERRLPQDGRLQIKMKDGRKIDFRASSLKTLHGEKIVLRILDHSKGIPALEDLGFANSDLRRLLQLLKHQHGMILSVGPTGSGKSTTLAAALASLKSETTNIITIEDPIEYEIPGVNQTQIHDKIKLTFASSLRSILRQDPDIILVGEIRDHETAQIALQAAQTGHLVLSTLHTDDAPSVVTRLSDMGIEPYIVGSALIGVIAQRLVRRLCEHCRVRYSPSSDVLQSLKIAEHDISWPMYRATGCPECRNTGYCGRIGIYEVMSISDRIARMISERAAQNTIRDAALEEGMTTLGEDGLAKVKAGITSPDELLRVVTEIEELRTPCPGCGTPTGVDFLACPECGRRLGGGCPNCGRALKAAWKYCPFCASRISRAPSKNGEVVWSADVNRLRAQRK